VWIIQTQQESGQIAEFFMTESEWLTSESPQKMRAHMEKGGGVSERKLRLFACACCRRVERWFVDPCQHVAVDVLEKFADGLVTRVELAVSCQAAGTIDEGHALLSDEQVERNQDALDASYHAAQAVSQATCTDPPGDTEPTYFHRIYDTIMHIVDAAGFAAVAFDEQGGRSLSAQAAERKNLADLLRCVIGSPFRSVDFNPEWRTDTAVYLAKGMYESRDFSTMPILADALQDAGCNSDDVLDHCRDKKQTHVRGCWVVDLVLERS
jgi:hypothetical protein